jgi:hypothetical protein
MPESGWFADPLGRHEKRFFNGIVWTSDVQDGDVRASDPMTESGSVPPTIGSVPPTLPAGTVLGPQYVVVAPQKPGNGPAVGALTLGIVAVLCAFSEPFGWVLGIICGVLGLILGTAGLVKASRGASHSALALSGLILGLVASIVAVHTASDYYRVERAIDRQIRAQASIPVVDANPVTDQVRIETCYRMNDGTGSPAATGSVVNESQLRRSLKVTVAFHLRNVTVYGYGITGEIDPGEKTHWFARAGSSLFTPTSCTAARPPHPIPNTP